MRVRMTAVYLELINSLRDAIVRARIQVRLTHGVSEMKINIGPGYRVYYTERGGELVVLLAGGDKSSQQRDIATAIELAENL